MQTGEIRPGRHDLSTVQTRIATEHTSLVQPTLEAFQGRPTKRPVIERVIGFFERPKRNGTSAAEKRLKAIRQDQSSEPFRPFLELMLNSVDYGGDNLRVYVALTKDGGQQIVIGDRPDGLGMSTDVFLNTYLDPYASGSAANNRTPIGEYKRGLMGVGAQQQFGLLRHPQDRLIVSTSQAGETTVAEFIPGKRGRIEMTIGGKQDSGGDKSGVIQIIKLSSKTCREIGFTPEGLAAYLHERLALLEGKTIDMVVVGPQGREKSLDTANVSSAYAAGMQRGWESIQAAASPPIYQ